jgi:hypothetical protein
MTMVIDHENHFKQHIEDSDFVVLRYEFDTLAERSIARNLDSQNLVDAPGMVTHSD